MFTGFSIKDKDPREGMVMRNWESTNPRWYPNRNDEMVPTSTCGKESFQEGFDVSLSKPFSKRSVRHEKTDWSVVRMVEELIQICSTPLTQTIFAIIIFSSGSQLKLSIINHRNNGKRMGMKPKSLSRSNDLPLLLKS